MVRLPTDKRQRPHSTQKGKTMKLIKKTSANFESAHANMSANERFINNMPEVWQKKLQKVLDSGGFLKIEICLLAGGQVDSKLILISGDGEAMEITPE
jgi:hypothetical protein